MTDREIETLIGRAAAKTRRRAWSHYSSEVAADRNGLGQTETDGESVRFSVIGEEGARQLDETFRQDNLTNLSVAKEMSDSGKDAKTIKLATGWEKGGDGKWRMEIPDLKIKTEKAEAPVILDGYLDTLIDAPELFKAYPQLRNIIVKTATDIDKYLLKYVLDNMLFYHINHFS